MAKARKSGGRIGASGGGSSTTLRVSRSTLARVRNGRVITNHRPTVETQRKIELLMAAIEVLRLDEKAVLPLGVPGTYEQLYDRAVEQFLALNDAEPASSLAAVIGPTANRRPIWVRGDLILRIEEMAASLACPVSRLIDAAIDTYVDYYTRGIDLKLIGALTATAAKILDTSEATGQVLRDRERKARKLMRTGRV